MTLTEILMTTLLTTETLIRTHRWPISLVISMMNIGVISGGESGGGCGGDGGGSGGSEAAMVAAA